MSLLSVSRWCCALRILARQSSSFMESEELDVNDWLLAPWGSLAAFTRLPFLFELGDLVFIHGGHTSSEVGESFHWGVAFDVYLHRRCFLPRCWRGFTCCCSLRTLRLRLADQDVVREALAEHIAAGIKEPLGVSALARVEPVRLLIEVAEEMERLDRYVSALEGALQKGSSGVHVLLRVAPGAG
jgi:hypothetical protein